MNRQPFQSPPRWWESKLTPWWVTLCRPLRQRQVQLLQKIRDIQVVNGEVVRESRRLGHGVLITPNHSAHYDSNCLYLGLEQLGTPCHFMTAWQVFGMAPAWQQWSYQRHGCFSIDRESMDTRAFRHAVSILQKQSAPLVIFPEGDIHHVSDRVMPFREGAAAIALSAARQSPRQLSWIPCGIKFRYLEDPTPSLKQVLSLMEQRLLLRPANSQSLIDRVFRLARTVLCIKEIEEFGRVQPGEFPERLTHLSRSILNRIAGSFGRSETTSSIPESVKDLRRRAIQVVESSESSPPEIEQRQQDLEDLFFVIQLYSYPGNYLIEHPTIERIAETVDKLEEDILGVPLPTVHGCRRVTIQFGEAIPIVHDPGVKGQVSILTSRMETGVQELLNRINSIGSD